MFIVFGIFDAIKNAAKNMQQAWQNDRAWIIVDLVLVGLSMVTLVFMTN